MTGPRDLPAGLTAPGLRWVRSACPYCGVGCGLLAGVEGGQIVRIKGDPDHPANFGELCAKAVFLPPALRTADRCRYPLARPRRDAPLERVTWDGALARAARKIRETVVRHGPDAVAVYGSGQLLTEDYYVWNKLVRGVLGTNNFDSNSRLCMASAAAAYAQVFGADGPPTAYADIELADCVFLIGTNTAECHPIVFRRIEKAKRRRPELRVLVADPRRTETADLADLHLPLRPGSDIALLNAMLHVCLAEGLVDRAFIEAHTTGFDAVADSVARYTPDYAAEVCALPRAAIVDAARTFGRARAALSFWSMGLNQSTVGVAKNTALMNLHLATGQVARPGAGPFSLTGQPNAMGGREVGGLAHLLPGYRSVARAEDRAEVAAAWGIPAEHLSPRPGLTAVELFEALAAGRVRVLWVICTNPAASMPELDLVERALRQAELVVVQDAYHPTETSRFADIVLPAAQWGERDGVMTNSERRITYLPKLVEPPGEALPDWQIGVRLARALGAGHAFPYDSAEAVFEEFKRLTRGRPADITGVSYARLRSEGPLQWPCPEGAGADAPAAAASAPAASAPVGTPPGEPSQLGPGSAGPAALSATTPGRRAEAAAGRATALSSRLSGDPGRGRAPGEAVAMGAGSAERAADRAPEDAVRAPGTSAGIRADGRPPAIGEGAGGGGEEGAGQSTGRPAAAPGSRSRHPGTARLYQDRRFATPDGRARFVVSEHAAPHEEVSTAYPLILTTGRLKNQWHTMTRTGKVEALLKGAREPFLEMNAADAARLGIRDAAFVEVASRRGKAVVQVRVTEEIAPGTCFMPFHWGRESGHYKAANNLTVRAFDPVSKEPELKFCAVRVAPADTGS